jgi:hypothetical protein
VRVKEGQIKSTSKEKEFLCSTSAMQNQHKPTISHRAPLLSSCKWRDVEYYCNTMRPVNALAALTWASVLRSAAPLAAVLVLGSRAPLPPTRPPLSVSVLSYNLLADCFARRTSDGSYDGVPSADLAWPERAQRIVSEIVAAGPDIACLQVQFFARAHGPRAQTSEKASLDSLAPLRGSGIIVSFLIVCSCWRSPLCAPFDLQRKWSWRIGSKTCSQR